MPWRFKFTGESAMNLLMIVILHDNSQWSEGPVTTAKRSLSIKLSSCLYFTMIYFVTITPSNIYWNKIEIESGWVVRFVSSSETQGQIVRARESLNGRENMARRKEKNGQKSPWGQCLTRPVPNGRRRSAFWLGRKTQKFSGTNHKPKRQRH